MRVFCVDITPLKPSGEYIMSAGKGAWIVFDQDKRRTRKRLVALARKAHIAKGYPRDRRFAYDVDDKPNQSSLDQRDDFSEYGAPTLEFEDVKVWII